MRFESSFLMFVCVISCWDALVAPSDSVGNRAAVEVDLRKTSNF